MSMATKCRNEIGIQSLSTFSRHFTYNIYVRKLFVHEKFLRENNLLTDSYTIYYKLSTNKVTLGEELC